MSNYVRLYGEGNRGPSPEIFGDLAKMQHDEIRGKCIVVYDDFGMCPIQASVSASGGYYTYQDTGVTIQGADGPIDIGSTDAKAALGVLEITGNDADNDEGHVQFGYGGMFRIGNTSGNTGKVCFEARFKKSALTDEGVAAFIGLGTGPVAHNYLVDDTGELIASKGFVGFRGLNDDGDKLDIVYQAANQTLQTVLVNAVTLVAAEYVKLGFIYDPSQIDASKKIRFFVDETEAGSYVSTTNIDAATFPEDEALAPMLLTKVGTSTLLPVGLDWVCAVQYGDNQE